MLDRYLTADGLRRRSLIAVLAAILAFGALGCGEGGDEVGTSAASIRAAWNSERARTASEIADRGLIIGWDRTKLHSVLGRPAGRPGATERWTSGCSGPGCYNLMVRYENDRVVEVSFFDEG